MNHKGIFRLILFFLICWVLCTVIWDSYSFYRSYKLAEQSGAVAIQTIQGIEYPVSTNAFFTAYLTYMQSTINYYLFSWSISKVMAVMLMLLILYAASGMFASMLLNDRLYGEADIESSQQSGAAQADRLLSDIKSLCNETMIVLKKASGEAEVIQTIRESHSGGYEGRIYVELAEDIAKAEENIFKVLEKL